MAPRHAWVLNLDADLELAAGAHYQPTARTLAAMRPHAAVLASALLDPSDLVIDVYAPAGAADGLEGRAFCPTPRALALLRRAGAVVGPAPDVEVLRRVNGRAFCSALGPTLPGARFVVELADAIDTLAHAPELSSRWRLKRAFGMAGRGQRVIAPGALAAGDLALLRAAIAEGGVQLEPDVSIEIEYARHGLIDRSGALRVGALVRQRCDGRGAWISTEPIAEPSTHGEVAARLEAEVRAVARALHDAGYFGPFGVDAFTYRTPAGTLLLQPRSEINARYSIGFAVGLGRA